MKTLLLISFEKSEVLKRTFNIFLVALILLLSPNRFFGQELSKLKNDQPKRSLNNAKHKPLDQKVNAIFLPGESELWKNEPFGNRDITKEVTDKRDAFSKHFLNEDGSYTAHIASGPIHYQENGQWKTIFHSISPSSTGFENVHNSYKTFYPASSSGSIQTVLENGAVLKDMLNMRMYFEANGQILQMQNIQNKTGVTNFNELTYAGVYGDGIDLRLTQHSTKRKMDYVINNLNALGTIPAGATSLVFEETVEIPLGWTAELIDNVIYLFDENNEAQAKYEKPIFEDASVEKTVNENQIKENLDNQSVIDYNEGIYSILQNGRYLTIMTKVELVWLLSESRSFPLIIDPTVNYSPNNTAHWTGWSETYQNNACLLTSPYYAAGSDNPYIGRYNSSYSEFAYAKFNIAAIPDGATINSVELRSNVYYDYAYQISINIRKIVNEPVAATGTTRLNDIRTGSLYNAIATGAAGNFASAGWKNHVLGGTASADIQAQLSSDWFAVGYDPYQTYWCDDYIRISGHSDGTKRPIIVVNYSFPCPAYTATLVKTDPGCTTNNGTITVTPTNTNFAGASYWYWDDFSSATPLVGSKTLTGTAVIDAGNMRLTNNVNSVSGQLEVPNPGFDASQVKSYFDMYIGSGNGADGMQISYGLLTIWFDTYRNNVESCLPQNTSGGATAISVLYNGAQVACFGTQTIRGAWQNVEILVNSSNQLYLKVGSVAYTVSLGATGYSAANKSAWTWRFFGATGGANDQHRVDNINIIAYNQFQYSIDNTNWQNSNVFSSLAPNTYTVYMRAKPTQFCTNSNSVGSIVLSDNTLPNAGNTTVSASGYTAYNAGKDINVCPGTQVTVTRTPGSGTPHYWAGDYTVDLDDWDYFDNQTLGNSFNYTFPNPGDYLIRCHSENATCGWNWNSYSDIIVHVSPVNAPDIAADQTICSGDVPAQIAGAAGTLGAGTYAYLWKQSTDNGVTWSDAPGTNNGQNYTPPALSATTLYKRLITSNGCVAKEGELVSWSWTSGVPNYNGGTLPIPANDGTVVTAGSSIRKIYASWGATDSWNAGAISSQRINNNGGYVEFEVEDNNKYRMCGLGNSDTDPSYTSIEFAIYPTAGGTVEIYESGVYKGTFGTYVRGDVFRCGIENNIIRYYKNGVLFYTSLNTPTLPLYADVSIYTPGGGIKYVRIQDPVKITVNPNLPASVSIAASPAGAICAGTSVTFTATPTNGGTPSYQWKLDGSNVGTGPTYSNNALTNTSAVTCEMTSTATCVTGSPATSNAITISAPTAGTSLSTNGQNATCAVSGNSWIRFYEPGGNFIGAINGNNSLTANVTMTSYVGSASSMDACDAPGNVLYRTAYMGRNWVITSTAAPTGNVSVLLPFSNGEMTALTNAAGGVGSPTGGTLSSGNPSDNIDNAAGLHSTKYSNPGAENGTPSDNCSAGSSIVIPNSGSGTLTSAPHNYGIASAQYAIFPVAGFSEFYLHGVNNSSPLPVELIGFSGTCTEEGTALTWQTASESNNDYFTVQRSRDGINWEDLTTVNGNGNSTQMIDYNWLDATGFGGMYYRLTQVDFNGDRYEKQAIFVNCESESTKLNVYPNPTQAAFTVEINSTKEVESATISIIDVTGKALVHRNVEIHSGVNTFNFGDQIESGTYLIRVSMEGEMQTLRLVVKN